jgi:hypothetical protein
MNTKYGNIPDQLVISYLERLTGKVYKILPMKEEKCNTLDEYIENLLRELISNKDVIEEQKYEGDMMTLINTMNALIGQECFDEFRSDVLKSLNIIKKMKKSFKRG